MILTCKSKNTRKKIIEFPQPHWAVRVIKSIGATLHDRTCPLKLALTLDTTTCEVKTWWKLQSCIISAKSVVSN